MSGPDRPSSLPPSERASDDARDALRTKLMDIVERLSANPGPDTITLDGVAHRAGVSHATVEKEFPTRADLLQATFHRSTIRLRELSIALLAQVAESKDENSARNSLVKMFDLISAPDRAPLLGAVIASGRDPFPDAMERGLRQIGSLFHAQRRDLFGSTRSLKDTLYLVELTTLAMYGELALGDAARDRLGLPVTSRERREFRRWFADKLLELGRYDKPNRGDADS